MLLLGASEDGGGEGEGDSVEGEEAREILQEAGRVARALGEDLERWQVRWLVVLDFGGWWYVGVSGRSCSVSPPPTDGLYVYDVHIKPKKKQQHA